MMKKGSWSIELSYQPQLGVCGAGEWFFGAWYYGKIINGPYYSRRYERQVIKYPGLRNPQLVLGSLALPF
jgi:hypothetical protein